ncbi:hypothetical protein M758_9G023800 [Ceratodon purpureus]|nr:hypothetical protein M758_9G023800 [Ceratodon purpureus]KAG0604986.1 hypothetical protein M758_9G023800 [Ceratodon purpureus]KAG0604987.1 hypothetical protein M758_9G023800 [Ceratodon purpureus]KAG0604988.1 hypothetical protein M758_9G023800 [Ceratodon purpureus]
MTFSSRSQFGQGVKRPVGGCCDSCSSKQQSVAKSCKHRIPGLLVSTLYLTVTLLLWSASPVRAQTSVDQGTALMSLAKAWGFKSWDGSTDPCTGHWPGITCDANYRVLKIDLTGQGLKGSISPAIGQLVYLESLVLQNNNITDPIPAEIGNLVHLRELNLINNSLSSIPPEAITKCNLTHLLLSMNHIRGQLPAWIGSMVTLTYLDFSTNELWGGFPPEYGNLRNLETLWLWENELSGFLPNEWHGLVKVNDFGMGHLYTTGPIPEWLFTLPELRIANFMRSQFIGPLPNLTKLMHNGISNFTIWDFSCNFLTGDYPTQYYTVLPVPNISLAYYSNCYHNETDGSPTITSQKNATQNTPTNCSRTYNCDQFYEAKSINLGQCAPCPPSQFIIDEARCICGIGDATPPNSTPIGAVVGGVVGGMAVTIFGAYLIFLIFRKKPPVKYPQFGRKYEGINDPWIVPEELHRFTLQELERATDNFSDEFYIGEGGFGKVYRGILDNGKAVAIKCASNESAQGQLEFRNELTLLSRLHHRHLCGLEGFCDEDGLQILVYEFMQNGDLYEKLFGENEKPTLNAAQRREIAVGIARGLEYLHSFANPPVIHRDIKLSNVLLDQYNVAKLADFGISKISPELNTHVSTRPLGTMGYIDPDYFRTNQLTVASDVYAFGIVLLELTTGQRVFEISRADAVNLHDWVRPRFRKGGVQAIIDKKLGEDYDERLFTALTEVGLMCSRSDRMDRPTMKEVLNILEPFAVSKSFKKLPDQPRWSAEYFKDKSLFEESKSVPVTSGNITKPSEQSANSDSSAGDPSTYSFDNGRPSTMPYDSFTALHPR